MREPELWIGGIVAVVLLGGFFIFTQVPVPTAMVSADPCDCLPSTPVCGVLDGVVYDYPSACHAVCADARVIFADFCGNIP